MKLLAPICLALALAGCMGTTIIPAVDSAHHAVEAPGDATEIDTPWGKISLASIGVVLMGLGTWKGYGMVQDRTATKERLGV